LKKFTFPPKEFFAVELCGNWRLLLIFIPLHILAMFSEEIMWRGYILPLQEISFGNWAWVVNGILWAWIVHAALKWHFVGMLPSMLIAPYIAQQTGSTWASFAVHALGNSPLWILLLIGVIQPKSKK
jgi:membrane protease YdiL (CAAX protease family)